MKSQVIRVSKTFSFDMAHALYGHEGLCKNIHGHTYHLKISVRGVPKIDPSSDLGMIIDFGVLKKIIQDHVLSVFDHALVLYEKDPLVHKIKAETNQERLWVFPFQPTCENLLLYIVELIRDKFPLALDLCYARLDETPSSFAEWLIEDQAYLPMQKLKTKYNSENPWFY